VADNYLSNYQTPTNQVPIIDGIRFDYYAITPTGTYGSISGIPTYGKCIRKQYDGNLSAFSLQNYNDAKYMVSERTVY
jgi:hypothetical protein